MFKLLETLSYYYFLFGALSYLGFIFVMARFTKEKMEEWDLIGWAVAILFFWFVIIPVACLYVIGKWVFYNTRK